MSVGIPTPKEVLAHAYGISDKRAKLRFLEIQMDAAMKLSAILWDAYSLETQGIVDPIYDAAERVCQYDWTDNDEDAVEAIDALCAATTHSR